MCTAFGQNRRNCQCLNGSRGFFHEFLFLSLFEVPSAFWFSFFIVSKMEKRAFVNSMTRLVRQKNENNFSARQEFPMVGDFMEWAKDKRKRKKLSLSIMWCLYRVIILSYFWHNRRMPVVLVWHFDARKILTKNVICLCFTAACE